MSLKDVVVKTMGPRWLLVAVRAQHLQVDILVLHAPHGGHPFLVHEEFWDGIHDELNKFASTCDLYVLADTNAHVKEVDQVLFGASLAQKANMPAVFLEKTMREFSLTCPQSFLEHDWKQDRDNMGQGT